MIMQEIVVIVVRDASNYGKSWWFECCEYSMPEFSERNTGLHYCLSDGSYGG